MIGCCIMRSEKEMLELIINFAKSNHSIKAILLNGSRANPNSVKDGFMDYDIVYVVETTKPFIENKDWISYFGKILIMQEPDNSNLFTVEVPNQDKFTYLMQFDDGNRIDLTFATTEFAQKICKEDSQTVVLLDKTNSFNIVLPPSDKSYFIKKPTENEFLACCNEFWWLSTYVAKGLWRKNIIYCLEIYSRDVHPELMNLLRWYVGTENDFKVTSGKYDKHFKNLLPPEIYNKLLKTYPEATEKSLWESLKTTCNLFDEVAKQISCRLDYKYDGIQSKDVMKYIFEREIHHAKF